MLLTFFMTPEGKLPEGIKETLAKRLPGFAGKKIRFSFEEAKDKRSLKQNDYYWAAIVPTARFARFELGDPMGEKAVHEDLLEQFAPRVIAKRMDGTEYSRPKRTSEMNETEMNEYMTAITATLIQFGFPVKERA